MNNIKLLSSILKRTNTLIKSEEYREAYRIDNSFLKARQNISPEAFKELCRVFTDSFYNSNVNLKKWNGFNVFNFKK